MGDRDRVYLIEILLRARDEFKQVFADFAKNQKEATKAEKEATEQRKVDEQQVRSSADALSKLTEAHVREKKVAEGLAASIAKLRKEHEAFLKTANKEKIAHRDQVEQIKRFAREWRKLQGLTRPGTELSIQLGQAARAAEDHAALLVRIEKNTRALIKREIHAVAKAREDAAKKQRQAEEKRIADTKAFNDLAMKAHMAMLDGMEKAGQRYEAEEERRRAARIKAEQKAAEAMLKADQRRADEVLRLSIRQADAETREAVRRSRAERASAESRMAHTREVERVTNAYYDLVQAMEDGSVGADHVRVRLRSLSQDFDALARSEERGSESFYHFADLAQAARNRLRDFNHEQRLLASESHRGEAGIKSFFNALRRGKKDTSDSAYELRHLSLAVHGVAIAFSIKYAQALITMLVGLGGVLVTVASAAIQAGAAIAGSLVAGMLQAIPVAGLFAAAMFGVAEVIKAVNLANQNSLTRSRDAATAARAQEAAAERVRSAEMALADASRGVADAQDRVNDARFEAVRQLEDLVEAEERARLAAIDSTLSLEQAQSRLRTAMNTGDASQVAQAQADLARARAERRSAPRALRRARQDLARARSGADDIGGVQAASRALADARRREAEATRDLARANNDLAESVNTQTAAQDRLQEMIERFTPAQRKLYDQLTETLDFVHKVFIGTGGRDGVAGAIIYGFSDALERASEILRDNRLITDLGLLSQSIRKEISNATGVVGGSRSINDLRFFIREARDNLPIVGKIFTRIFETIRNVGRAASPALRQLLELISDYAKSARDFTEENMGGIARFFSDGVDALESFIELLKSAAELLFELMRAGGAEEGVGLIDEFTDALKRAAEWVRVNSERVHQFYRDSVSVFGDIIGVARQVAIEIARIFNPASSRALADFLTIVLIPALSNVVRVMGFLTKIAHEILSLPVVSEFTQWVFTIALLSKGFHLLRNALIGLAGAIGFVRKEGKLLFVGNPWTLAIMAIVTAITILDSKLGIFEKFSNLFKSSAKKSQDAADAFTAAINRQIEALRRQRDAEISRVNARLGVARAEIATQRAREQAREVGGIDPTTGRILRDSKATLERREASIALKQAIQDEKQARLDLRAAKEEERKADEKAISNSRKALDTARDRISTTKDQIDTLKDYRNQYAQQVEDEEKRLQRLTPGTSAYADAQIRLKSAKESLAEADRQLESKAKELEKATDGAASAFRNWRRAVKSAGANTETFGEVVHNTMETIANDANGILTEFGMKKLNWKPSRKKRVTPSAADAITDSGSLLGGFPRRQHGGFAVPGSGDGDSVYMQAKVEPGERVFILNRTASRALGALQAINRMFPRFQSGGLLSRGFPDAMGALPGLDALAYYLNRKFGLQVTSGLRPGAITSSGNPSDHGWGGAIDVSNGRATPEMDRAHRWLQLVMGPAIKQMLYRTMVGGDHFSHIHVALKDAFARSAAAVAEMAGGAGLSVGKRTFSGPDGALKNIIVGVERTVRRAANRYIERQLGKMTASSSGSAPANIEQVNEWASTALRWTGLFSASNLRALVSRIMQESGGDPNVVQKVQDVNSANGDPAIGLAQVIGATFARYRDKRLPNDRRHPIANLVAAIRYMMDRYGRIVGANGRGYRSGGAVPGYGGGDVNPRWLEGGEHVWTKEEVARAGGHGVMYSMRRAFGGGGQGSGGRYRSGGAVDDFMDVLSKISGGKAGSASRFRSVFNKLFETGGLFDQMVEAAQAIQTKIQTRLRGALYSVDSGGASRNLVSVSGTTKILGGDLGLGKSGLQGAELARREQSALQTDRDNIVSRGFALDQAIEAARHSLAVARSKGDKQLAAQIRAQIKDLKRRIAENQAELAQNSEDIVVAQERFQQELVDAVEQSAQAQQRSLSRNQRLMAALGRSLSPEVIANRQIEIANQQIESLNTILGQAQASGNTQLASQIREQIEELQVVVAEASAQAFQASIDEVNRRADKGNREVDRSLRIAQIGGRTDFGAVGSALAQRSEILNNQRSGLMELSLAALASGNIDRYEELQESIADLDVSIAENTQAIQDNTDAATNFRIGEITGRAGFSGGVLSGAISFFQAIGQSTGVSQNPAIAALLSGRTSVLQTERSELIEELADLLDYSPDEKDALQGLSPTELVNFLVSISSGPGFDSIMERLNPTQQESFKTLINSILANIQALQENTDQIKNLTGSNAQGFTSSFWRSFRAAIFDGAGKLLPQYRMAVPQAANGAMVLEQGILNVHPGEVVVPAKIARLGDDDGYGGRVEYHDHWEITTPKEVVSYSDLSREASFVKRLRGRGRP